MAAYDAHPGRLSATVPAAQSAAGSLALLYAVTIVGFPLISTLPLVFGFEVQLASIPYRVFVVGLVLWILGRWCFFGARVYAGALLVPVLLYWLLLLVRMFWDLYADPLARPPLFPDEQLVALSLGACFLPAIAFLELPSAATLTRARHLIELFGSMALILLLWLGSSLITGEQVFQRLGTEVLNPVSLGQLGVSVFIVTGYSLARGAPPGRARFLRVALGSVRAVVMLIAFAIVIASFSRGPILLMLVAGIALSFIPVGLKVRSHTSSLFRLAILVSLLVLSALAAAELERAKVIDVSARFDPRFNDASSRERLQFFDGAVSQFESSPLLGDRYIERESMSYPHNAVLEGMMSLGVIGLLLALVINAAALLMATRLVVSRSEAVWIGMIFVQYFVAQLVAGSVLMNSAFWAFLLGCFAVFHSNVPTTTGNQQSD